MIISVVELKMIQSKRCAEKKLSFAIGPTTISLQDIDSNLWAIDLIVRYRHRETLLSSLSNHPM